MPGDLEQQFWEQRLDDVDRTTDDFAWIAEADDEPPRLEWRAAASTEFIRWQPPVPKHP